jgi:hypothetical protein
MSLVTAKNQHIYGHLGFMRVSMYPVFNVLIALSSLIPLAIISLLAIFQKNPSTTIFAMPCLLSVKLLDLSLALPFHHTTLSLSLQIFSPTLRCVALQMLYFISALLPLPILAKHLPLMFQSLTILHVQQHPFKASLPINQILSSPGPSSKPACQVKWT